MQTTSGDPVVLRAPASKSQTQRALLLAALVQQGESEIQGPLDCDDSRHLRRALAALGATIDASEAASWRVARGDLGRRPPAEGPPRLWCGEAGSTLRFLAPLGLLVPGGLVLDGEPRLGQRPLAPLTDALGTLGAELSQRGAADGRSLPLWLGPGTAAVARAARLSVDAATSSQFASALLMIAPLLPGGLELELTGDVVSRPYLELTLETMRAFGVAVAVDGARRRFVVEPAGYRATRVAIEGDWSAAAFLLAGGLIARRPVTIENVVSTSTQGDRVIVAHLERVARDSAALSFDLSDCPDLIAPLALACALGRSPGCGPVRIGGVAHARHKESDRVAVLADGLRAAGVEVDALDDGLIVGAAPRLRAVELDPRGDHRMAMAFGLLSLREPGIAVADRHCVAKSYPDYWRDLETLARVAS